MVKVGRDVDAQHIVKTVCSRTRSLYTSFMRTLSTRFGVKFSRTAEVQ